MHPVALIPLASALGSSALAAAIFAREPGKLENRLVAAALLCGAWWSLCETLVLTAADAGSAVLFARLATIGGLMLSAVVMHLLFVVLPLDSPLDRGSIATQYLAAGAMALASVGGPWIVPGAQLTRWGYTPMIGPLVAWAYALLMVVPASLAVRLIAKGTLRQAPRPRVGPWVEFAIGVTVFVASVTDFMLPALGHPVPRLGSTSVTLWGLATWWAVYRFGVSGLSPRKFASEILATLPDGVALVRLDGRIRALNGELARLARRAPGELVGRPIDELIVETAAAPAGAEREAALVSATGARIPVSLSDAWLRDDAGAAIGRVLVVRDLEELVSLRSRLLTSARLAAVGQLAAGIAHEINNPIAYVRSNVSLLERHWKTLVSGFESRESPPAVPAALARSRELLEDAAEGIDRVASIVRDVGGFSTKGGSEHELTDPVELLETAIRVAGPQLRRKASVERSYAKLPLVPCRPQELVQVFLDLVLACVHAIERDGCLRVASGVDGMFVWVEIRAEGASLAPAALERILDPFPPAQEGGPQAALGLAISRQIVERQGGRILIESQPQRSMRFRVSLPTAAAAPDEAA